jgi:outer membrane protein TolC
MRRALMVVMATLSAVGTASAQGGAQQAAPVRLSLGEALRIVDSASEAIGIARAGVRSAEAGRMRARSAWLPQLNGSVAYTRTLETQFSGLASGGGSDSTPAPTNCGRFRPNPDLPIGERLDSLERGLDCSANGNGGIDFSNLPFGRANQWNFGLSASQTLFNPALGGRQTAANAAQERAEVALAAARASAVVEVAEAYFDAQLAERLLVIADSALAQSERALGETRLAREVGNAAEFDLLRASVARDNQRPLVIQRRIQRDQAFLRLRQLLDLPQGTALDLITPLGDTTMVALPPFAAAVMASGTGVAADRAPVREAEALLRASDGQLSSARGSRLPSIALSSDYAKIAFPDDVFGINNFLTDWTVSVRVRVPLYTGGALRADVLSAAAARDDAALRVRQATETATREAEALQLQLAGALSLWEASAGTAEQATRAYGIAEVRVRNGLSTLTDLAEARLQLQQAEANRAQAARDLQVARLRLVLLRDLPFGVANGMTSGTF